MMSKMGLLNQGWHDVPKNSLICTRYDVGKR